MPMPWDDPDPLAAFGLDAPQADTLPLPVVPAGRPATPPAQAPQAPPAGQGDGGGLLKMLLLAAPALMLGTARGGVGAAGAGLSGLTRGYLANREWQAQQQYKQELLEQRAEAARIARERTLNQFLADATTHLETIDNEEDFARAVDAVRQRVVDLGGSPALVDTMTLPKTRTASKWVKQAEGVVETLLSSYPDPVTGKPSLAAVLKAVGPNAEMVDPFTGDTRPVIEWIQRAGRVAGGQTPILPQPPTPTPPGGQTEVDRFGAMTPEQQATYLRNKGRLAEAGREPRAAGGGSSGPAALMTGEDVETIADAIVEGQQPPDTKGLYRFGGPLRAALARRGYNLTRANLDWEATKRFFASANSTQQLRMKQAADTAFHSLDVIETLAQEWKASGFPVLNRAKLAAAKNGLLGPQAASIATRLEAQISDIVSELGNVYMGGNSPTDHSLDIAAKNLSADWSEKVLLDAVELARTNLRIRINALKNVQAVTPTTLASPEPLVGGMTPKTAKRKVGDVVTRKNGQRVRITAVLPDGTYEGVVVP